MYQKSNVVPETKGREEFKVLLHGRGFFLQIKAESISNIRGPRGRGIQRGRRTYQNCGESERRIGNAITPISQTSLQNTDNNALQNPLNAVSGRKCAITREHAGEKIFTV